MASRGRCGQVHHVREEVNLHGEAQGQLVGSRRHRGGRARPAGSSTQSQWRARELLVCHQRLLTGVRLGTIQRAARRVASEGLDYDLPRRPRRRPTRHVLLAAAANVGAACLAQLRPRRLRLPVVLPLCFQVGAHSAKHAARVRLMQRAALLMQRAVCLN
eukprot:scaffold6344_cov44-Phaeocystis_antarctica.AAC.1